jgi:hypothetical protein
MPNQILYTPRTSMYSAYNSHRNSYQSARSYTEFGARAPRTSSHHQRMPSGSYAPNRDASVTESPTDVDDYSTASGQSSAQSSQVGSNRRRQGHAIV